MLNKLLTDNEYVHKLSVNLTEKINIYLKKEGIEKTKLQYGLEIIIIDLSKVAVVLLIALLLGTLFQTVVVLMSFNVVRFKAYGVHARNAEECLIGSIILFAMLPFGFSFINLSNTIVAICFAYVFIVLFLYAPADTKNTPIVGEKRRKKFKVQSIFISFVLLIITLLTHDNNIKTLICLGAVIEAISLLPITYKILGKSRNNYEKFEESN